jgi:hypothetical protein
MTAQTELRCRCGEVRGKLANPSSRTVNRVICYCDDCQAFAHHLGRANLLDAKGGTDIVQVAPASLVFVQGQHRIQGIRLTPKGLFRWYASCCNTPVGNTLTPAIPFVGIIAQAFASGAQHPDEMFGRPIGSIMVKYAIGDPPVGSASIGLPLMARAIRMVLSWRLRGQAWPHPFFKRETGAPIYPLSILSPSQRESLRRFCGPHPTTDGRHAQ